MEAKGKTSILEKSGREKSSYTITSGVSQLSSLKDQLELHDN
jgi:hypothetical protein